MMNITIYRQEEGRKFLIQFDEQTPSGKGHGFAMTLDVDDMRTLTNMLVDELADLDKSNFKEEVIWNPRSKRHERVIKK